MFQLMLEKYNNASMHEEAIRCLSALGLWGSGRGEEPQLQRSLTMSFSGQSKDKECIEKLLEMTLDEKQIRTSDAVIVYRDLGASNTNRPIAWNFMKTRKVKGGESQKRFSVSYFFFFFFFFDCRWDDINNVFGGIAHLFHRMIAFDILTAFLIIRLFLTELSHSLEPPFRTSLTKNQPKTSKHSSKSITNRSFFLSFLDNNPHKLTNSQTHKLTNSQTRSYQNLQVVHAARALEQGPNLLKTILIGRTEMGSWWPLI